MTVLSDGLENGRSWLGVEKDDVGSRGFEETIDLCWYLLHSRVKIGFER